MGEEGATKYHYLSQWTNKGKGGFRAAFFVYGLVALENMGFIASVVSFFLYFMNVLRFDLSGAANTLTNFMGSTFLLSLVGGFISDTFINRFHTCLIFGCLEILAFAMITIQAHFKNLHPSYCGKPSCSMEGGIAVMFYVSLCFLALGSGGVRGALPALGADQFDQKDPKGAKALGRYFNWLLLSTTAGATVGVTVIVKASSSKGYWWGFFMATILAFLGFIFLSIGAPFYRLQVPEDSPIIKVLQVIVAAFKNRKLLLPESADELHEINEKESVLPADPRIKHTSQFSWLDKAAIFRKESEPAKTPWTLCTVTQVEEVKILTRMLPIIASTVIMNTCLAQLQTFSLAQGNRMDLHLGNYTFPAASIPVIPLLFMSLLIPIYEFVFVPFARKITKHPLGITQLQRVGVGLVLSAISMTVAGIVEVKRRNQSLKDPLKPISLFWLSFQYGIFGIADMFTLVGLLEFFYREAPVRMRSLSTSFTFISLSFGYFLSGVFVDIINSITKRVTPSKLGWLHGQDLDRNNLNLFYWFLAILSCINFVNYLYWATWYKYKTEEIVTEPIRSSSSAIPINRAQDDVSKSSMEAQDDVSKPVIQAHNDASKPANEAQDGISKPKNGAPSVELTGDYQVRQE